VIGVCDVELISSADRLYRFGFVETCLAGPRFAPQSINGAGTL
jgi:hypothetical protein